MKLKVENCTRVYYVRNAFDRMNAYINYYGPDIYFFLTSHTAQLKPPTLKLALPTTIV